jgi:hypothetical protein
MLQRLDPSLQQLSAFEMVVLLTALARMQCVPSPDWLAHFFKLMRTRLKSCGPTLLTLQLRYGQFPLSLVPVNICWSHVCEEGQME